MGLPCVSVVKRLEVQGAVALVHRELEGGLVDVMDLDLPALITIQTGINAPRYANLRAIKQAEQLTITVLHSSPGHSTSRVRSMCVPEGRARAESLGNDPVSVAERITELVKERLG
jgi:electron transfer flavoprotein beta subunit